MMDVKIEKFLLGLPGFKRALALQVRAVFLEAGTSITETIKWNQLCFVYGKANIAFIYSYPKADYLSLGFFRATELNDPGKIFEGTGKGMRHIKIRNTKDIPVSALKNWIKQAVDLEDQPVSRLVKKPGMPA
jgi:hypothetical protein